MKASRFSREAASAAHKFGKGEGYRDPFNLFGKNGGRPTAEPAGWARRGVGRRRRQPGRQHRNRYDAPFPWSSRSRHDQDR